MKRVMLTVGRGKPKYAEMALGLGRSLSLIGDDVPRAVVTDLPGFRADKMSADRGAGEDARAPVGSSSWAKCFDQVIPPPGPRSALDKLLGLELTDADAVLAVDSDCLAFRRLGPIFDYCRGKPFVVIGHYQKEGIWHGADVAEICRKLGVDKIPSFNGGLIYYERSDEARRLIDEMKQVETNYAATGFADFRGNASEEVCVLLAMAKTGIGEVIPDETDFMNTAVGLVGKLTMDVMRNECHFVCRRHAVRFVRPYIFHASRYSNFRAYWKQLDKLAWLDAYEDRHPYGYISPWSKLRRSVERRYLKYVLRKL